MVNGSGQLMVHGHIRFKVHGSGQLMVNGSGFGQKRKATIRKNVIANQRLIISLNAGRYLS